MWRYACRHDMTLGGAAEKPAKNTYRNISVLVAEVFDPVYLEECGQYLVNLKVIDPTFNFAQSKAHPKLVINKFAHIYIYCQSLDQTPKINQVGDVLRLYYARFTITAKGELACYTDDYCDWRTYDAEAPLDRPLSMSPSARKVSDELTQAEANYMAYLIQWGSRFFSTNSLKDVIWWKSLKKPQDKKPKKPESQAHIDLFVQCTQWKPGSGVASFEDKYGNKYTLKPDGRSGPVQGRFYHLGGVDAAASDRTWSVFSLTKSKYFSMNCLPVNSKDTINFDKLFAEVQEEKKEDLDAEIADAQGKKGGWEARAKGCATQVAKRAGKLAKMQFDHVAACLQSPAKHLNKEFVLEGRVGAVLPREGEEAVKRFFDFTRTVQPLSVSGLKNLKSVVVFNLVLTLRDPVNDLALPVYINTCDHFDNPFSEWELFPDVRDVDAWQELEPKVFAAFTKKLAALEKEQAEARVVARVMMTKAGRGFLKMVDTRF